MLKFLVGFLVQGNFQAPPACRLFPHLPPLFSVSQSSMRGENTDRMREIHLRSYTIQTHGAGLARKHTHDWVVLVFLPAVVLALHYAARFSRFVGKDMMTDIRYPVKQSTVPAWGVPIISVLCPVVIFVSIYIARRDVYDLHHATLGVLFAVLIAAVITDVIKNAVGRPRPDFFWRHFPDGKQLYDQVTDGVICHGEKSLLKDGRKSFPSGHTSWSFAGLGFLSPYLSGKIKAFDRQGHVALGSFLLFLLRLMGFLE